MRKFLALVLALVMTMSLVTVSAGAATDFADDADITNAEAVEVLNAMGVLTGNNGKFNPNGKLTRGAGAKIIAYLMLGQTAADKLQATYTVFEDVTDSVGLAAYIEWAEANGIVGGYGNGKFGPYDVLTEYAFGKMLLAALGYDAAEQGYTGAGWQKNVYRDAVATEIFDGTETFGACIRDTAARMAFGALQADIVVYASASVGGAYYHMGHIIPGVTGFQTATGVIRTGTQLYTLYGLTYAEGLDVYGRPGHKWTYAAGAFSKFYADAPVKEYTTAVTECDLLVDLGVAKTNTTSSKTIIEFKNGVLAVDTHAKATGVVNAAATHKHSTACTTNTFGGQGVLTQVFKLTNGNYILSEIDTHLTKVDGVVKNTHNIAGVTNLTAYYANGNYGAYTPDSYTVVANGNLGYVKGDYILTNLSMMTTATDTDVPYFMETKDAAGAVVAATIDGGIALDAADHTSATGGAKWIDVAGVPTVIANGKYAGREVNHAWAMINATHYAIAEEYELSASQLKLGNQLTAVEYYDFFVDQYGNVIGDRAVIAPYTYAVIQHMAYAQQFAPAVDYVHTGLVFGDVLDYYKVYNFNNVTIAEETGATVTYSTTTPKASQYSTLNTSFYNAAANYGVVKAYLREDGGYDLMPLTNTANVMAYVVADNDDGAITKGNPNIAGDSQTATVDNNTVFVIKYIGLDGKAAYKTVTGIDYVDSMDDANFVAVYEGDGNSLDSAAAFVYVDLTAQGYFTADTKTVFVMSTTATADYITGDYEYVVYDLKADAPLTVTSSNGTLFNKTGVWTLTFNGPDAVSAATMDLAVDAGATYTWTNTAAGWNYGTAKDFDAGNLYLFNGTANVAKTTASAVVTFVTYDEGATTTTGFAVGTADTNDALKTIVTNRTTADFELFDFTTAGTQVIYKTNALNANAVDHIIVITEYAG